MFDFVLAFLLWQWYEVLGLPLRFLLAPAPLSPEVRRTLSRVAGPVLLAFPVWLAAYSSAGVLAATTAWAWLVGALVVAWWLGWRGLRRRGRCDALRMFGWDVSTRGQSPARRRRRLAFQFTYEAIGFALFFGFVAFRRWVPEMTSEIGASAAEKFMNQMLLWANWHAVALPAQDYWYAGHPILYYDWAHWHWAWVARTAGFRPEVALNLCFARATLLCFEATFLLGRALGIRRAWAVAGAVGATWFGNFAGVVEAKNLIKAWQQYGVDWSGYGFWGPSRAIKNVVDEFPAFSAILGDFHAHHLALPWLLTFIALLAWGRRRCGGTLVWGAMVAGVGWVATLANLWHLPLVGGVIAFALLICLVRKPRQFVTLALMAVGFAYALKLLMALQRGGAELPFDPTPPGASFLNRHGIYALNPELRSTPWELFALWGLPAMVILLGCITAALTLYLKPQGPRTHWKRTFGVAFLCVRVAVFVVGLLKPSMSYLLLVGFLGNVLAAAYVQRRLFHWRMVAALAASVVVLVGLEFFYVKDRFEGDMVRYNSYFKFSYPVWPVLMLGGAAALHALWHMGRRAHSKLLKGANYTLFGSGIAVAALGLVFPVFAMPARILQARRGDIAIRRPTLDSVSYIAHRFPMNQEALLLREIRERVPEEDVIIEAGSTSHGKALLNPDSPDGGYDYGGRIASLTGHPVPLGWIAHEQQWRGSKFFTELEARAQAVDQFYQAPTPAAMRVAAHALGAHWALFGVKERSRYGAAPLQMLKRIGHPIGYLAPGEVPSQEAGIWLFDLRQHAASPKP